MERYTNRVKQYRQNKLLETNQRRLYQEFNGENMSETVASHAEQSKEFWGSIWDDPVTHNASAEWLKDVQNEMSRVGKQQNIVLSPDKLKLQLRMEWNGPCPDVVQGYWIKYLTPLHERIVAQLNTILSTACVPQWMTTGRTVLCMKDPGKGNAVDNYRPISCFPVMWKVFSGMLAEEIYEHLEGKNLFPHEQKGCKKKSRGTKDQLLIDKVNLAMAWIDYRKAYDMIPHSWILECMRLTGVSENIMQIVENSMQNWKTMLTPAGKELAEVHIRRGIFQGDSQLPLLFVICLIPMSLVLRKVKAGYSFGNDKPKVNHLLFMDDIKLFGRSSIEIDKLVSTVYLVVQISGWSLGSGSSVFWC